jgi:hypothetical protein
MLKETRMRSIGAALGLVALCLLQGCASAPKAPQEESMIDVLNRLTSGSEHSPHLNAQGSCPVGFVKVCDTTFGVNRDTPCGCSPGQDVQMQLRSMVR